MGDKVAHGSSQLGDDSQRDLRFFPQQERIGTKRSILTEEQVLTYDENGFVFPVPLFSREEIASHREYFDRLQVKAANEGQDSYSIMNWQNRCDGLYDIAYHPRVLDVAEEILGPDLVLFRAHYFCKMPQGEDSRVVTWHQDAPYWPISPSKCVTVWLALSDVDEENGAMKFIAQSHMEGKIPYEYSDPSENNVLNLTVRDPFNWGTKTSESVCLKAGQASLHSDLLLHGSGINTSNTKRIGLALTYFPPDVRSIIEERRGFGWLCRGNDPAGYWMKQPDRPDGDRIPSLRKSCL